MTEEMMDEFQAQIINDNVIKTKYSDYDADMVRYTCGCGYTEEKDMVYSTINKDWNYGMKCPSCGATQERTVVR